MIGDVSVATEIFILSGFLGSGKTSLLTQLLQFEKSQERKVGVIMNELGQVSIDSTAVSKDTPLAELLNGCVCCSLQDQFESQLQQLLFDHSLDVIYVETTGAAHPMEVFDACMSPLFAEKIIVKGVISIVDLYQWKHRKNVSPIVQQLMNEQVRHADLLLLNKMDLVSEQDQASSLYEIQSLNSHALCLLTTKAKINLSVIQQLHKKEIDNHTPIEVSSHLHLKSMTYTFSKPIHRNEFEQFLQSLPDTIYRIKGFLRFTNSNVLYSFQYSYGVPLFIPDMMNYPLTLVLIGENINTNKLREALNQLESDEPSNPAGIE